MQLLVGAAAVLGVAAVVGAKCSSFCEYIYIYGSEFRRNHDTKLVIRLSPTQLLCFVVASQN